MDTEEIEVHCWAEDDVLGYGPCKQPAGHGGQTHTDNEGHRFYA